MYVNDTEPASGGRRWMSSDGWTEDDSVAAVILVRFIESAVLASVGTALPRNSRSLM